MINLLVGIVVSVAVHTINDGPLLSERDRHFDRFCCGMTADAGGRGPGKVLDHLRRLEQLRRNEVSLLVPLPRASGTLDSGVERALQPPAAFICVSSDGRRPRGEGDLPQVSD